MRGRYGDNPYCNRPAVQLLLAISAGPVLGIARGAMDVFLDRPPGRAITYTSYRNQAEPRRGRTGHPDGEYLDGERFLPFWERVAELGVPVYLRPGIVPPTPTMFGQYPQLYGATWGWGGDTATHALRLVLSGLFERFPGLTIVLGHMGEQLPFCLWRLDSRYAVVLGGARLARRPSEYLRANFMVTTSGACSPEPLRCAIDALGADRVMFATDYPYEDAIEAARFLGAVDVTDDERTAIAHGNAEKVFGL